MEVHTKNILITGGVGFIGSHLASYLAQNGAKIICLDDFSTCNTKNINDLKKHPNIKILKHDVRIPIDTSVDEIYNLASPASPAKYQKDPIKTLQTNILGTTNMLELARKYKARLFQASTSEVYGNPIVHPQPETYWGNVNPNGIRSSYNEGKRCAESLCYHYSQIYDLDVRVMRIFNTYGPNMAVEDGRVISNFIVQALKNEDLIIKSDGNQTRSFCYISDLVDGINSLMTSQNKIYGPLNCGNDFEISILELAKLIIRKTNSKSRIIFKEKEDDDPEIRKPDLKSIKEALNWKAKISLDEGLFETIKYFKNILNYKNET